LSRGIRISSALGRKCEEFLSPTLHLYRNKPHKTKGEVKSSFNLAISPKLMISLHLRHRNKSRTPHLPGIKASIDSKSLKEQYFDSTYA
jgi:hypothetical protein